MIKVIKNSRFVARFVINANLMNSIEKDMSSVRLWWHANTRKHRKIISVVIVL